MMDDRLSIRVGDAEAPGRPIVGLGVEAEPPPFLYGDVERLTESGMDAIMTVVERRLRLLRPAIARLFCFVEQWNPSLDGETFVWDDPNFRRHVRMLELLRDVGCRVNLVLFTQFNAPTPVQERAVQAMVGLLVYLRDTLGMDHVDWLTLFNEPETAFRQDTPLAREIFGAKPIFHTWDEYVALNRLAMRLLSEHGLSGIRLAMPDSAWGGPMRGERMGLTAAAFPDADICFSYHHYNPDDPDFNATAPPAFHYFGMQEEVERFRHLVGPDRQLVIWEFNNAGAGFGTHFPGTDTQGRNVLEAPDAGAKLAARVLAALRYGADGLCLWHMNDGDVNKFGLWRDLAEDFAVKPYWHYYALLCHAFRPGQRAVPVSGDADPVIVLATVDADGTRRLALLNNSDRALTVALDGMPLAGGRLQRLDPSVLPGPDVEEPFRVTGAWPAGGLSEIALRPWELAVLTCSCVSGTRLVVCAA